MLIGWKAIAKFLMVSERTLRRWKIHYGRLPHSKIGNIVYAEERDIKRWMKQLLKTSLEIGK